MTSKASDTQVRVAITEASAQARARVRLGCATRPLRDLEARIRVVAWASQAQDMPPDKIGCRLKVAIDEALTLQHAV